MSTSQLQPPDPRRTGNDESGPTMDAAKTSFIPERAQTLQVLRLIEKHRPLLMLPDEEYGFGILWVLDGQQVQPAIAKYLMKAGFVADNGATEFGARILTLTDTGRRFRDDGMRWWKSLGWLQRLKITLLG